MEDQINTTPAYTETAYTETAQDDALFRTHFAASRELAEEYADVAFRFSYKHKARKRILISSIIFLAAVLGIFIHGGLWGSTLELFVSIYSVAFIIIFIRYKRGRKKLVEILSKQENFTRDYAFYEDKILVREPNGTCEEYYYPKKYPCVESDNLLVLTDDKRAFVIRKDAEDMDIEAFRAFIGSKTKIERHDRKMLDTKMTVINFAALFLVIALGFCAHFTRLAAESRTAEYTYFDCTVTLPHEFKVYDVDEEDGVTTLYNGQGAYVFWYILEESEYEYDQTDAEWPYYDDVEMSQDEASGIHDVNLISEMDGEVRHEIKYDTDGNVIYSYNVSRITEHRLYVIEFYCRESQKGKYKPLFEKWADTITINEPAKDL